MWSRENQGKMFSLLPTLSSHGMKIFKYLCYLSRLGNISTIILTISLSYQAIVSYCQRSQNILDSRQISQNIKHNLCPIYWSNITTEVAQVGIKVPWLNISQTGSPCPRYNIFLVRSRCDFPPITLIIMRFHMNNLFIIYCTFGFVNKMVSFKLQ